MNGPVDTRRFLVVAVSVKHPRVGLFFHRALCFRSDRLEIQQVIILDVQPTLGIYISTNHDA